MPDDDWTFPHCPQPGAPIDWPAAEVAFPWLAGMAGCPQDPAFHAEGDVLVHTRMVGDALVADPRWQALPPAERSILFAAALLHDVAKPKCTMREQDGRISSKGHALKGTHAARRLLYASDDLPPAPFAMREAVAGLVRHHGLPLTLLDKPSPTRAIILASMTARCDWLALLAEADVRGRTCADAALLLDRVALFRDFAREHGCESAAFRFPSDHSRVVYFEKGDGDPTYHAYDDTRCQVILMSGLPGAGKDTWRTKHGGHRPVVSLDALRESMDVDPTDDQAPIVRRAKEQARDHLRSGRDFVWNATSITRTLRRQIIGLCRDYSARVRIVYIESPYRDILSRNRNRPSGGVPRAVIDRMVDRLDVPDPSEAADVEWVVAGG